MSCMVYFISLASLGMGNVYIQGTLNNNSWKYDDGSEIKYFNWAVYQPDGQNGESCLNLWQGHRYLYHDVADTVFAGYVCELVML